MGEQFDDGGPAFPRTPNEMVSGHEGMTLWDFFAAHAPVFKEEVYGKDVALSKADAASRYADAMLAQRRKRMEGK